MSARIRFAWVAACLAIPAGAQTGALTLEECTRRALRAPSLAAVARQEQRIAGYGVSAARDLGWAMNEIRDRLFREVRLPPGADIEFGGLYQIQSDRDPGGHLRPDRR